MPGLRAIATVGSLFSFSVVAVVAWKLISLVKRGRILTALWTAHHVWVREFTKDSSGHHTISLPLTARLLNSKDVQDAVLRLTNVPATSWSEHDLKPWFDKADAHRTGRLTRVEFLGLYLALAARRVLRDPVVLLEVLLGFLDTERKGRIEGKELKALLTLFGFPAAWLLPIPAHKGVDYRHILNDLAHKKKHEAHIKA